jgi:hypothetical protein
MLKYLQFVLDAVVDAMTGGAVHLMGGGSHAVGSDDQTKDGQECDNFHDILNI